jgi:hypothetical protein
MHFIIEAIFVGFITLIIGTLISKLSEKILKVQLPTSCKDWNKHYIMEFSLFATGFAVHIACEVLGMNKWYCRNGDACKS